jgi:phage tail sheath gpL-like
MGIGAISFNQIPSNIRTPGFFAEISAQNAGVYSEDLRALIIGQTVNTIASPVATLISTVEEAKTLFGAGSMLARQVDAFKRNNDFTTLWVYPLADAGGSVAATGTLTLAGTATAAGTLHMYVAGQYFQVGVASTDTPTVMAANLVLIVNGLTDLPVTASSAAGVVTFTAKNKGTVGNSIDIRVNHLSELGGQALPAGVTATIVAMASGATDPTLTTAFTGIGDNKYEYFIHPYTDTTNLDLMRDFLDSRWGSLKQLFGHAFTAKQGTSGTLASVGAGRNDPHHTVVGYYDSPTWQVEAAAMYGAVAAYNLNIDPARTLQTLPLVGFTQPKEGSRFTISMRSTLLNIGIATLIYSGGYARIERAITTYQKNAYNQADPSYLDVTTLCTLARIVRELGAMVTNKWPRSKLAADGTVFGDGQEIVTPNTVRAELIALYDDFIFRGLCQNAQGFEDNLIVTLNPTDPNRLDVLLPPTLINNLIVFAAKVEFSLRF